MKFSFLYAKKFSSIVNFLHNFSRFLAPDNKSEFLCESFLSQKDRKLVKIFHFSEAFVCTPCWMRFKLLNDYERAEKWISRFLGCFSFGVASFIVVVASNNFPQKALSPVSSSESFLLCFACREYKKKNFSREKMICFELFFGTIFSVCQFPALGWN